ncbi:MAG: hypothetical protein RJQ14_24290, partial [Marinoscillum sp.]
MHIIINKPRTSFFLMILLLAGALHVQGQARPEKAHIAQGKTHPLRQLRSVTEIVGYDNLGMYVHETAGIMGLKQKHFLYFIDQKMNMVRSSEIPKTINGNRYSFEQIIQTNNHLYVLGTYMDKKNKESVLMGQPLSMRTLKPAGEPIVITSAHLNLRNEDERAFKVRLSRDNTKILVIAQTKGDHDKGVIIIHVLDSSLKPLWQHSYVTSRDADLFDLENVKVDNHGNVFILGIWSDKKSAITRKNEPNYYYKVIGIMDQGATISTNELRMDGKFLTDMQMEVSDQLKVICLGFYSQEGTVSISGTYYIKLDPRTNEVVSKSHKAFGLDFITQGMGDFQEGRTIKKVEKGKDVQIIQFDLNDLVITRDGAAFLIGEQFFTRLHTSSPTNGAQSSYLSYHYKDIMVVKASASGEIEWITKIVKNQSLPYLDLPLSYSHILVDDQLYLI